MKDRYHGERKIILDKRIHGNVHVTIHGKPFKIVSVSAILYPKWPKLLYFKPESAQI